MSNGWIPTTERLPADKATTLYYSQTGVWFDEQGEPYKVAAWMPLPEVFRG